MARLSEDERRARAEQKVIRSAAWRARRAAARERREAQQRFREEQRSRVTGTEWAAETQEEKRARIERRKSERAQAERRRRQNPEQALVDQHVTVEAQRQGDYVRDTVPGPVIVKAGKEKPTSITVVRNRGGTAIERWQARGDLTTAQIEAIAIYCRAWRLLYGGEQRVTANWSLVSSVRGGERPLEEYVGSVLQAKAMLRHFDEAIFFGVPLHYLEIWRNVVIFDEATGTAGSRLGYRSKQAEAAAKVAVIFVADMIATDLRLGTRR